MNISNLSNNNSFKKELIFFIGLYLSLILGFLLGENSSGGAYLDYLNQKNISQNFSNNFFETLLNYEKFPTRHSPVLIIFLSIYPIVISSINLNNPIVYCFILFDSFLLNI